MRHHILPFVLFNFFWSTACQPHQCADGLQHCFEVAEGRYLAIPPNGLSSFSKLDVLFFFHGYGSSAEAYLNKTWITDIAAEENYLLVIPDGIDNTWAHRGSPSTARDELSFIDSVVQDLESRWELSEHRVVGGFSQGASMVWDLACYRGDQFTAFIPASGAFWNPLPAECDAPVHLRHTHGTADRVVPMEGRPIGSSHQGDVNESIDIIRSTNGCNLDSDRIEPVSESTCSVWSSCTSGMELQLCLHDGEHSLPSNFMQDNLTWARNRPLP